jgi:thymidylate synthase
MISVVADNGNAAWRDALGKVFNHADESDSHRYVKDIPAVICIDSPSLEVADPLFPMKQKDLDVINKYIVTGEEEDKVIHEWTKLYYHRMFDQPFSQIEYFIRSLRSSESKGGCQISMWDKTIDQESTISPCTQVIWGRRKKNSLELHVHAHSSDAFKKLLMNIQEFIAVHHYVAQKVGLSVGRFIHFIDSCHIYREDQGDVAAVVSRISAG